MDCTAASPAPDHKKRPGIHERHTRGRMFLRSRTLAGTLCSVQGLSFYKGVETVESVSFLLLGGCQRTPSQGRPLPSVSDGPGASRGGTCWAALGTSLSPSCRLSAHTVIRGTLLPALPRKARFLKMKKPLLSFLNLLLS